MCHATAAHLLSNLKSRDTFFSLHPPFVYYYYYYYFNFDQLFFQKKTFQDRFWFISLNLRERTSWDHNYPTPHGLGRPN